MKTSIKVAAARIVAESNGETISLAFENGRRCAVPGGHGVVLKSARGFSSAPRKAFGAFQSPGSKRPGLYPSMPESWAR